MTCDDYRAMLKAWGLTPAKPGFDGHSIYQTRDGQFTSAPEPEWLSEQERKAALALIAERLGIDLH